MIEPRLVSGVLVLNGRGVRSARKPGVGEIVDYVGALYRANRLLAVTQVREEIGPAPLPDDKQRFDGSELRVYDITAEDKWHGILLGTRG